MSSKRRQRRKGCTGKVRYMDVHEAWAAARSAHARGQIVRPYPCTFCKGYHVGHFSSGAQANGSGLSCGQHAGSVTKPGAEKGRAA